MVKITNEFGDVKRGVQGEAVYQQHYGNQIRRMHKEHKNADTVTQHHQRDRFRTGIDFAKGLTKAQKDFIKSYMAEAGITNPEGLPTTWYSFAKKIAMTVPEVKMEVEAGEGGFSGTYAAWSYRKPITLNNTGSAQSDYQVLITLTAANFDYSKCKNDGSDIRFAASNGSTPLKYWIEDWNYNGTSKIWVKVDSIPGGSNVCLYIYYDNSGANSESNGPDTFELFDMCEETTGWNDVSGSPTKEVVTDPKFEGEHSLHLTSPSGYSAIGKDMTSIDNFAMHCHIRFGETDLQHYFQVGHDYANPIRTLNAFSDSHLKYYNGSAWVNFPTDTMYAADTWYELELRVQTSSDKFELLWNEISIGNNLWDTTYSYEACVMLMLIAQQNADIYIDKIFICKYASPAPTDEIGEEESGGGATKLKEFSIHHPAIKSYEIIDTGTKEESLSNLEDHISASVTRKNLNLAATAIKVITLADQEYTYPVQ